MLRVYLNFTWLYFNHKLCGQLLLVLQDSPALKFADVLMEPTAHICITGNSLYYVVLFC